MPTVRAFVIAGAGAALLAASLAALPLAWLALALDAALVVALVIDGRRAAGVGLSARRILPPLLAQGAAVSVEVELQASRPVAAVELRETLHPALATAPLRRRVDVGSRAVWRYDLTPRQRGEHGFGPLMARITGPWGLATVQRELIAPAPARVYPQVRWEGRAARLLALADRRQLGQIELRRPGQGGEPYALRDYRPGDPQGRIHWKATARHDRPIVREDVWERGGRLLVMLDCGRSMASVEGARSKLDHALAAALALVRVAVARGDRVTVVSFADRVERVVGVRPSTAGIAAAYRALYDIEARLVEPAYDLAFEALAGLGARRAAVVLFTSVVDLAAAELLRDGLRRAALRHRPLLVNLEDAQVVGLAHGSAGTPDEAFAKASALEILLANRALATRLRRSGVRVASVEADRLALVALEAYLDMASPRGQVSRR